MRHWGRRSAAAGTAAALVVAQLVVSAPAAQAADPVSINLLTINDFHGRIADAAPDPNTVQFAGTVESLRQTAGPENTLLVGAGDLIGASLFASARLEDQPTIDVMNQLGLDVSAVGNHEFDQGFPDLTDRVIADGTNAEWDYLGANVYLDGTTTPALPEYGLYEVAGVTVGVIGAVTQETPALVSPSGVAMLDFGDPVEAINRVAGQLSDGDDANGEADVLVATLHEGASEGGDQSVFEEQFALAGVFASVVNETSAEVDVIVNGHTHQAYAWNAPIPGSATGATRPVIQTGQYAANVGQVQLRYEPDTDTVVSYTVANVPRLTTPAADLIAQFPDRLNPIKMTVDAAVAAAAVVGNQPVGSVTKDITTATTAGAPTVDTCGVAGRARDDRASESTLSNLVANALLETLAPPEAGGAQIGVVNPGGLRAELCYAAPRDPKDPTKLQNPADADGRVLFSEANAVLPFVNELNTIDLTGAQFKTVLEQQWQRDADGNVPSRPYLQLGVSDNVSYTYDPTRPEGSRIVSVMVDGEPLDPAETYSIGSFEFLIEGGDNFREFRFGKNLRGFGLIDRDAWIAYLKANPGLSPDFARHSVVVTNQPTTVTPGAAVNFTVGSLDLTSLGRPANTTLLATLVPTDEDGEPIDLGTFNVVGGAATVSFTAPAQVAAGSWAIVLAAAPSGTVVTIPVTVKTASVTLSASPTTQIYGSEENQITLTATVTASTSVDPGGFVEFWAGTTLLGTSPVEGGVATFEVASDTPAGTYSVVARYSGDDDGAPPAQSAPAEITIEKAQSTIVLAAIPFRFFTFRGAVLMSGVALNNGRTASGSVQYRDGDALVATAQVRSGAALALVVVGAGSHSYVATFVPDDPGNIEGNTSVPVVVER